MTTDSSTAPETAVRSSTTETASGVWVWSVCVLLLLASSINYMDRQTLSSVAPRVIHEFQLTKEQYGTLEQGFGVAFALGALFFGYVADRTNIRWLYPGVLLAWSLMGFLTGWANGFIGLMLCRTLLGFFESGHWPCALKTTQRLLPSSKRTLGNSVLQSGTAIGAIITPLILGLMLTEQEGSWRPVFQAIGLVGAFWVLGWFALIRGNELAPIPSTAPQPGAAEFWPAIWNRRFLTLVLVVMLINACYHFFRVWLPLFLQEERQYTEATTLKFLFWYYIANDVGCLGAGFLTAWLARTGWNVHFGRVAVFALCAALTSLSLLIPLLPQGPWLLATLLLISMGSLGMFPCYYAFSQELTHRHQGKVTGLLGAFAWLSISRLHVYMGRWIDTTKHADYGLAVVGVLPLLAVLIMIVGWGPDRQPSEPSAA